jgi:hypothetical protein
MKSYLIAAVAVLSLTACGSSPDGVVREFYTHLADGNTTKAAEMISPQTRSSWGGKIDVALLATSTKIAKCGGLKKLDIEQDKERSTDNFRVFKVTVTMKSDDKKCGVINDTVKTFKNDGKWYIQVG